MGERVVIGFYGSQVDAGAGKRRWNRWRPTVSLFQQPDLKVDRLLLLLDPKFDARSRTLLSDIASLAPDCVVQIVPLALDDPWDFAEVYGKLLDVARRTDFAPDDELLVHMTPGSHVSQICLFLLTEARFLPGQLLQTTPRGLGEGDGWLKIDLDLARYDALAQRLATVSQESTTLLKQGIATANPAFNELIDRVERVALQSTAPILLSGPTGAGKTRLARQIYELRRRRGVLDGVMVEMNCATLRGDSAMAMLFGHARGAYTGAVGERVGLMKRADGGLLFLDEVAELGLDEQAMLLRAVEEQRFLPMGSDTEVVSRFQLVAGSHADLRQRVREGRFREDLLARIDLWHFELPGLADRPEDLDVNLDVELDQFAGSHGHRVRMNGDARKRFLAFGMAPEAVWSGNFRDLHAAVQRMCTLADNGRIRLPDVDAEIERLRGRWASGGRDLVDEVLGPRAAELDRFDRVQLADVIKVCRRSSTLSAAGRTLFAVSRTRRASINDADRLRKYLAKYDLDFDQVQGRAATPDSRA